MATLRDGTASPDIIGALGGAIGASGDTVYFEQWFGRYTTSLNQAASAVALLQVMAGCASSFGAVGGSSRLAIDTTAGGTIDWGGSGQDFYLQGGAGAIHNKVVCRPTSGGRMFLSTASNNFLHVESGACYIAEDYNLAEVHVSNGASLVVPYAADTLTDLYLETGAKAWVDRSWTGKLRQGEKSQLNIWDPRVAPADWDQDGGVTDFRGGNMTAGKKYTGRGGVLDWSRARRNFTVVDSEEHVGMTFIKPQAITRTVSGVLTTVGSGPTTMPAGSLPVG